MIDRTRPRSRLGAGVLASLVIFGACAGAGTAATPSGAPDGPSSPVGSVASGPLPSGSPPAGVVPDEGTTAEAARAELDLRHEMWRELGVAESLGADGPAVIAAIDEHQAAFGEANIAAMARELKVELAAVDAHVASTRNLPGGQSALGAWSGASVGQVTFTATMLLALVVLKVESADQPFSGALPSKSETYTRRSGGTSETTRTTASMRLQTGQGRVSMDVDVASTSTITDAAGKQVGHLDGSARGHFDVNACPDQNGKAQGTFELTAGEAYTQAGVSSSASRVIKAPITMSVDDTAHLTSTDLVIEASGRGINGAAPWGVEATIPVSIGGPGSGGATTSTSGSATAADASEVTGRATILARLSVGPVAKAAQDFWRSGKCFEVKTNIESRTVKPGEHVDLEVSSIRQKFDGGEVRKPVVPEFSGKESLDPAAGTPIDMPAGATFNAGREPGDTGMVTFKQTSNRGIASKTLRFEVESQGLWVTVSAVRALPKANLSLAVPTVKLERTDRGYEKVVLGQITGQVDLGTCKVDVDTEMEVNLIVIPDEADRDFFRLHVQTTGTATVDNVDLTCNGTPIQVPIPGADFLLPFKGTTGYVELSIGETKTVRTDYVSGTATITRQAPP